MFCHLYTGDCVSSLRKIRDSSVNCCVTSPPYYNLRDYGVDGQLGLEHSPDEYISRLVGVFREVRRVLRDDGTLWLNIADTYCKNKDIGHNGLKKKDIIGIPWMLAFALRADGWFLRQDIIWSKPNPMPEPVTDRCTKSHEYIFLLSKSNSYYYDIDSIKEPWKQVARDIRRAVEKHPGYSGKHSKGYNGGVRGQPVGDPSKGRNKRSVWEVTTHSYPGAHFATFPKKLIQPCVTAGCPVDGIVLDPFAGSGTTGEVAAELGRNSILCELSTDYSRIILDRMKSVSDRVGTLETYYNLKD